MHPVLYLEHVIFHSTIQESFKHTATIFGLVSITGEDSGRKLLLVSHQDNFPRLVSKRYQIRQFNRLARLVDDQVLEEVAWEIAELL